MNLNHIPLCIFVGLFHYHQPLLSLKGRDNNVNKSFNFKPFYCHFKFICHFLHFVHPATRRLRVVVKLLNSKFCTDLLCKGLSTKFHIVKAEVANQKLIISLLSVTFQQGHETHSNSEEILQIQNVSINSTIQSHLLQSAWTRRAHSVHVRIRWSLLRGQKNPHGRELPQTSSGD
jgi:hypothetical protein